jgi:hypothetical protein
VSNPEKWKIGLVTWVGALPKQPTRVGALAVESSGAHLAFAYHPSIIALRVKCRSILDSVAVVYGLKFDGVAGMAVRVVFLDFYLLARAGNCLLAFYCAVSAVFKSQSLSLIMLQPWPILELLTTS